MEIVKANDPGNDLVYVVNWGARFNPYVQHDDGDLTNGLNLSRQFPSLDHEGNRCCDRPSSSGDLGIYAMDGKAMVVDAVLYGEGIAISTNTFAPGIYLLRATGGRSWHLLVH